MDSSEFHLADIAVVSTTGSKPAGFMIVPLVQNNDTKTQLLPIYSPKNPTASRASLPRVLNEVLRFTSAAGGLNLLRDTSVLKKLPKNHNLQSIIPKRQPSMLSSLSGLMKCKACPSISKLPLPAGDSCETEKGKLHDSKHNKETNCSSCLTRIDPGFKYCPSCGVLRRNASSLSGDHSSSRSTTKTKSRLTKCRHRTHFYSKNSIQDHVAFCKKQDRKMTQLTESEPSEPQPCMESPVVSKDEKMNLREIKEHHAKFSPTQPIRSSGSYNLNAYENAAYPGEQQGPLFECPSCLRTFLANSLAIHRRSCGHMLNFDRGPPNETLKPESVIKAQKYLQKERWRP